MKIDRTTVTMSIYNFEDIIQRHRLMSITFPSKDSSRRKVIILIFLYINKINNECCFIYLTFFQTNNLPNESRKWNSKTCFCRLICRSSSRAIYIRKTKLSYRCHNVDNFKMKWTYEKKSVVK